MYNNSSGLRYYMSRMTLLILNITKRLVWADNMFCVPEQLLYSDVVARERVRVTW